MSFTLGALPYSGWEQAIPLLSSLGWAQQASEEVESWCQLDNGGSQQVVILHRRPEYLIAAAIAEGQAPTEACLQWQQQAEVLLSWLKHNRRRACLVETDSLLAPDVDVTPLLERLGERSPDEYIMAALPEVEPLHLLYALQTVRQSEESQRLLAELEASTLPLSDDSFAEPALEVDALSAQLNAETADVRHQSQEVQGLLEQSQRRVQVLEVQLQDQKHQANENALQLQRSQDETTQLVQQLEASKNESALLISQLHLVQEELEAVLGSKQSLEEQFKDATAVITRLQVSNEQETKRVDGLIKQNDLLTEQAANLEASLEQAQKESSLLLDQLHLVQEELETVLRREKELIQKQEKARDQHQSQLNEVRASYQQASRRADDLQQQVGNLEQRARQAESEYSKQQSSLNAKLESAEAELNQSRNDLLKLKTAEDKAVNMLEQAREEGSLLLEQLHLVQDELETRFFNQRQLGVQLDDSDAALAVANGEIAKLQSELNTIKSSRFYKLVKPAPLKRQSSSASSKRKLQRNIRKLKASPLFDEEWYLMTHSDVAQENMDPARHYIKFGVAEGRDPSPHFNTSWYLQVNADVAESGINPLIHYIEHGMAEGRAPRPEAQSYLPGPRG